jgi:hypothetical protein
MKKITAIKVLENHRVWLRFNDGVEGELNFSSKPRTGVFAFWNNYDNFRKVRIGDGGELLWNDQLDFCPDSLWLQVTGWLNGLRNTRMNCPNVGTPRAPTK